MVQIFDNSMAVVHHRHLSHSNLLHPYRNLQYNYLASSTYPSGKKASLHAWYAAWSLISTHSCPHPSPIVNHLWSGYLLSMSKREWSRRRGILGITKKVRLRYSADMQGGQRHRKKGHRNHFGRSKLSICLAWAICLWGRRKYFLNPDKRRHAWTRSISEYWHGARDKAIQKLMTKGVLFRETRMGNEKKGYWERDCHIWRCSFDPVTPHNAQQVAFRELEHRSKTPGEN